MAKYNDPKTGQTVEANNSKSAIAQMAEKDTPKPSVKKKVAKVSKTTKKETE